MDDSKRGMFCVLVLNNRTMEAFKYAKAWIDGDALEIHAALLLGKDMANRVREQRASDDADDLPVSRPARTAQTTRTVHLSNLSQKPRSDSIPTYKHVVPKTLHMVDGDNNFKEATELIGQAGTRDEVRLYISQRGLYEKMSEKGLHRVKLYYVNPGDQAVDRRILKELMDAVASSKYERIFVISRDKGYDGELQNLRCTYGLSKKYLDRRNKFVPTKQSQTS